MTVGKTGGTGAPVRQRDPIDGELSVIARDDAYLVVVEEDPDDWLVRFENADGFDARGWAENMARVYNGRRARTPLEARFGALASR